MFYGAVSRRILSVMADATRDWFVRDIYQACSGIFTLERAMIDTPFRWHGNDVTMHSCALGNFYAEQPFPIKLRPEWEDCFGWFKEYIDENETEEPISTNNLASILLISEMLSKTNIKKRVVSPKSPSEPFQHHFQSKFNQYRSEFPKLHAKTIASINNHGVRIASFTGADAIDWMRELPRNSGFISFPPFKAGDYEQQFENLDLVFDWPRVDFQPFTAERFYEMMELASEFDCWFIATINYMGEKWQPFLTGSIQEHNRSPKMYIYSNRARPRVITPTQELSKFSKLHLGKDEDVGNNISLIPLTGAQFAHLRSMYMSMHIRPGSPSSSYGVMVDNRLIGCCAFSKWQEMNWNVPRPSLYMLSDFPVSRSKYKRLSKLVLYAALSKEMQELQQEKNQRALRTLVTTAFTPRPSSMKYRGLFHVVNRRSPGVAVPGVWESDKYMVNYSAPMGQWTLKEGLELWRKKHAQN